MISRESFLPEALKVGKQLFRVSPDIVGREFIYVNPRSGNIFNAATSGVRTVSFLLPNTHMMDPTSLCLYFRAYVTGTGASSSYACCANYVSSFFRRISVKFAGSSSALISEMDNYNIYAAAQYVFYDKNFIESVGQTLLGFYPTYDSLGVPTTTPQQKRAWNGRSFTLPLEIGFFTSAMTHLPLFILPQIQIDIYMEDANAVVVSSDLTNAITTNLGAEIRNPRLIYQSVLTSESYQNAVISKVQSKGLKWDYYDITSNVINSGTSSGLNTYPISAGISNLQKVMFCMIPTADQNTATVDGINDFVRNKLSSYRLKIGSAYYPGDEITIGNVDDETQFNADNSFSNFISYYSMGVLDRNSSGNFVTQSMRSLGVIDPDLDKMNVYLVSLERDPIVIPAIDGKRNNLTLDLILKFSGSPVASKIYVFMRTVKTLIVKDLGVVEVME